MLEGVLPQQKYLINITESRFGKMIQNNRLKSQDQKENTKLNLKANASIY